MALQEMPSLGGRRHRIELFNGFRILDSGATIQLPHGVERVVAFLSLHEKPLPRAYVAGILWGESTQERAFGNLRSALWRLRSECGGLVECVYDRLTLESSATVDLREVEAWAWDVLHGDEGYLAPPLDSLGELLPGWYDDWVITRKEQIRQVVLHALERVAEQNLAHQRYVEGLEAAMQAATLEPLRETPQRLMIAIYVAEGNRSEALRTYHSFSEMLQRELGIAPSPMLRRLAGMT